MLKLNAEDLKKRTLVTIDIASQKYKLFSEKETKDLYPDKIKLVKAQRGPLNDKDWIKKQKPICCVYKVVFVECKWSLIGKKIENFVTTVEHDVFTKLFRILYCKADTWVEMSPEQVAKFEQEVIAYLEENIKKRKQREEEAKVRIKL